MANRQWLLLATLILLAAAYICVLTNWGRHPAIQISHAINFRAGRFIRPNGNVGNFSTVNVRFNLDRPYRLTEVKVIRLIEWQTNKSALPLCHLISDSNSVPIRRFFYGMQIRGMRPVVANLRPGPLETNVLYRLFLTAGSAKGEHDFSIPR